MISSYTIVYHQAERARRSAAAAQQQRGGEGPKNPNPKSIAKIYEIEIDSLKIRNRDR